MKANTTAKTSVEIVSEALLAHEQKINALDAQATAAKNKLAEAAAAEMGKFAAQTAEVEAVRTRFSSAIERRNAIVEQIRVGTIQAEQQENYKSELDKIIVSNFGFTIEGRNPNAGVYWQTLQNFPHAVTSPLVLERLYPWIEARKGELAVVDAELAELAKSAK